MKIVIVEDELRIREGMCNLITKTHPEHQITGVAGNGKEGLYMIVNSKPDLIITDIKMPVMDGIEMLQILRKKNINTQTIVLSAYSEFKYAQQSILLGVSEYLIKPIAVEELKKTLNRVKNKLLNEENAFSKKLSSLDSVFRGILFGGLIVENDLRSYLNKNYNLNDQTLFALLYFCFEEPPARFKERLQKDLLNSLYGAGYAEEIFVQLSNDQSCLVVIHGLEKHAERSERLLHRIKQFKKDSKNINISVGWSLTEGIGTLKSSYEQMMHSMEWGIVLGEHAVVELSRHSEFTTRCEPCIYPIHLESAMKSAICECDFVKFSKLKDEFIDYFRIQKISPRDIKDSFIRVVLAIVNISKDVDMIDGKNVDVQKVIRQILKANLYCDLEKQFEAVCAVIKKPSTCSNTTTSLTVNRAKSLIHEFYHTGISLDEIAGKLNVTPEYLGTLFREKTGVNYTTYLRNYRINKAKKLLIGSNLRLYEISEKAGYSDPKYFSRVFREVTGQLPDEYRKMNK